ncbi:hypothetical protein PFISCL1PPCAC_6305, partial [Pristionchus fissidentatus]
CFSLREMADWDFLDEVDVLAKLSGDFKEKLESKKWQERKEALEQLQGLLAANPRLSTKTNYGEIMNTLQMVLAKDSNINCNALAAKCISGIATGIRTKFAPFANQIIPVCAERFKEKKAQLRDPLIECVDAVASTILLENLSEEIVTGMEKPNPQIKLQMDNFIFRQMNKFSADKAPRKLIKLVVPVLAKHANDADGDVREAALAAIGSVQRMIGDKNVKSMIGDLEKDENKMKKITEGAARASDLAAEYAAKTAPPAATSSSRGGDGEQEAETDDAPSAKPAAKAKEADPWDFADAFDVLGKMPSNFDGETGVESKKWGERKEALEALLELLKANIKLCPKGNYSELVGVLRRMLEKDANINVTAVAAKCLTHLATGLRTKFGQHVATILPTVLDKFKEKKPVLKDPLVELIDAAANSATLESMESDLLVGLAKNNPQIKSQIALFLKRHFIKLNSTTMPKKTLKALAPVLVKHTGEADTEVRETSCAALGAAMAVIGEKPMMTMLGDIAEDKLKMGKVKDAFEALKGEVEEVAPAPAPPPPKTESKPPAGKPPAKGPVKKAPPKEEEEEDEAPPPPKTATKGPAKKAVAPKEEPNEEEEEAPKKAEELLSSNEDKKTRLKDEKTLKILKWNFATPDDEHTNQLMSLLGAQAKASLVGLLFHKDFKMHIKAIEELNKMADEDPLPLVKNSDLILKWCTLRFFETNPAALIKVLDLANRVLNLCFEKDEPMSNEEAASFMPYLLLKSGEQKESMRTTVREIIDIMSSICGPLKLCSFVVDALKTKNSRQRTECLMVLEKYIDTVGLASLKPMGVMKAMAACVSDRDTGVRNAAINGIVACYKDEGDRIWATDLKGMESKERQMVEERIKRTGAAPGSARPGVAGTPATGVRPGGGARIAKPNGSTVRGGRPSSQNREGNVTRDSSPVSSRGLNSTFNAGNERSERSNGGARFQLDDDLDNLPADNNMTMSQLMTQLDQVNITAPSRQSTALKRTNSCSSIGSSVVDSIEALDKVIQNVSSAIADICIEAIEQLSFVLSVEEQRPLLRDRVNLLLPAIAAQVKLIRSFSDRAAEERLADRMKYLINFVSSFTLTATDLRCASAEALEPYMYEFIWIINDQRFKQIPESDQVIRSINKMAIKSCSMSEPNAFFVAMTNCISKDLIGENYETVILFTKCMHKFTGELKEAMDMDIVANTANAFYTSVSSLSRPSEVHGEAMTAVHTAIEKAFAISKANPRHVFGRVRNLDSRLRLKVDAWADIMGPSRIHDNIIAVLKKMHDLPHTIATLADYVSQRPAERQSFEKMLGMIPMGDYIKQLMREYTAFREGRSESSPVFPAPPIAALMQKSINVSIHSINFLGSDASSVYEFGAAPSMETSMALPTAATDLMSPMSSAPIAAPSTVTKSKRRTINPAELEPLKERLNQLGAE